MPTPTCASKLRPNVHLDPHMQTLIVVLERLDGRFCIFPSVMGTIWAMEEEEEGEKEKEEG